MSSEHYSYTLYADPATARTFDDKRFGGPIGELVAASQAVVLAEFAGPLAGRRVLDVGTGTGRAALLLARGGARVVGVDASEPMLAVARRRAEQERAQVEFRAGDAHALEFGDRAFDTVVSLRVLMHTPRWRTCVAELCRVADRLIVIDYPSSRSAARLESAARGALHRLGIRTEPYRVFSDRQIAAELERGGFAVRAVRRQFVLPIALHKAVGSPRVTRAVERALERLGLLKIFGSPVTIAAERCRPS